MSPAPAGAVLEGGKYINTYKISLSQESFKIRDQNCYQNAALKLNMYFVIRCKIKPCDLNIASDIESITYFIIIIKESQQHRFL